jgi:hypothetical protein
MANDKAAAFLAVDDGIESGVSGSIPVSCGSLALGK